MIGPVLLFLAQLAAPPSAFDQAAFEQSVSDQPAFGRPVFDQAPLADSELADLRGGIRLPNGIDAALTIETQTAVDGAIVLMTVVKIDIGAPEVAVFAPADGTSVPTQQQQDSAGGSGSQGLPTISFDNRNGLHIVPGAGRLPVTVARDPPKAGSAVPDNLVRIDTATPVQTDGGRITAGSRSIELATSDLQVLHLTGNAFGSAIANSGSDRAIDTQTTVSLDLRSAGPDVIGSAMLRVEDVAMQALAARL